LVIINIGKKIIAIIAIIVVIVILVSFIHYLNHFVYLKDIDSNIEMWKYGKTVMNTFKEIFPSFRPDCYRNYYIRYINKKFAFMESGFYKNYHIHYINGRFDQITHIFNNKIISHEYYMKCLECFNKHFSDVKYIKSDDEKFLYVQEKIKQQIVTQEILQKLQIIGLILGTTFFLYVMYKNIFR